MRQLTYKNTPNATHGYHFSWEITDTKIVTHKDAKRGVEYIVTGRITIAALSTSFDGIGSSGEAIHEATGKAFVDALAMTGLRPIAIPTVPGEEDVVGALEDGDGDGDGDGEDRDEADIT